MPYWPPCWSVATPLQFAQPDPDPVLDTVTAGEALSVLFS